MSRAFFRYLPADQSDAVFHQRDPADFEETIADFARALMSAVLIKGPAAPDREVIFLFPDRDQVLG